MKNFLKHIINTEFQIPDHLTLPQTFKENLSSYRHHLISLITYLSDNKLMKLTNYNCNSIMEITPVSTLKFHKNNKNNEKCIATNQFFGR